ncbi:MAG: hypothetical protein J0H12_01925 [Candidatus Paracaedimonas acanthamoebae]|uniref:Uncharacterized protein n=1 Tax=Candidatus Paracaedimonas acanthamoebae TaxID=244581 RepID=A0A8J7TUE1_9PROT|nr:hypothetical protein [Candidatus Paracaedimonas acanthamoebae]
MLSLKNSAHFIFSFIVAVGFSEKSLASDSYIEQSQGLQSHPKRTLSSKEDILNLGEEFPHDPLLVNTYSEETLINNWCSFQNILRQPNHLKNECLEELDFQQKRKIRKLENLYSYTLSSALATDLYEKAEYVVFAQVCDFHRDSPKEIAQKYGISDSVYARFTSVL